MKNAPDLAVVGGGLLGRLLAWRAARAGLSVTLYEAGGRLGEDSAAWAAAGMVSPAAEARDVSPELVAMGRHSLTLWPQLLRELPQPVFFSDAGTLAVWHDEDAGEAQLLAAADTHLSHIDADTLHRLEPALGTPFDKALYAPGEAQIDNRELLAVLADALDQAGVRCHWHTCIADNAMPEAGIVVDCRGMGSRGVLPQLRGMRGEILRLLAPHLELRHMLRLLHATHPVYVVPRAEGRLVVGATSMAGDDRSAVSVRGAMQLLSSATALLPALADARILEFATQVRPVFPDRMPAISYDAAHQTLRINGLYRHGFLLAPTIVEEVLAALSATSPASTGGWNCLQIPAEAIA